MEGIAAMMYCQRGLSVTDASQVGEVRRHVERLCQEAQLTESRRSDASIVATELAKNLVRYATQGEILLRTFEVGQSAGVEIISVDRGPGISDVAQSLQDGYSTGGTPGNGLGAVRRLSSEFDIFSTSQGTVVLSRIENRMHPTSAMQWGVVARPAPREEVSGDTWRIAARDGEFAVFVADGLGHGPLAAEASQLAADTFDEQSFGSVADCIKSAHPRMHATRGAAVAAAQVNLQTGILQYAGVGNIAGSLISRQLMTGQGLVSHNGTVGAELSKVHQFEYKCPSDALLIMYSDGLQGRWSLGTYPGLANRHPATIAAVLYREYTRGRDDVTVAVVRFSVAPAHAA